MTFNYGEITKIAREQKTAADASGQGQFNRLLGD